jgi:anti-sigma factor RsiW
MHRLPIAVAVALLLGGCGSSCSGQPDTLGGADTTAPAVVPSTQPTLTTEIGTCLDAFEALADGDAVEVIHGSQGGRHIWTVRVHGVPSQGLVANVSVLSDATPLGPESGWAGPWTASSDAVELPGMRAYVDAAVASGDVVTLLVEVVAKDGRHGADKRRVRIR